jgi:uncharacterized protein YegJ (DUF2314 family)
MMIRGYSMRLKNVVLGAIASVAVLGIAMAIPSGGIRAEEHSPVVDVPNADPEMASAIAKARATLPVFWASYEAPKPSETGHSLKVRFPTGGNNGEHIWMADVRKLGDGVYSGRFANSPRDLPGKRQGDLVEFREAAISDWMFLRNGKIVGGETIRPMLKSLPKADADALRARLETP